MHRLSCNAPPRSEASPDQIKRPSIGALRRLHWKTWKILLLVPVLMGMGLLASCGSGESSDKVMYIGGIPDQEAATLNRRFGAVADYLSEELDVKVKYVPSVSYAALVTAFGGSDIHLGWFGGLTGVQARAADPGAMTIAQRPRDTEFHSVFIVQADLDVQDLQDLKGLTFTFGSESSTSGHLMPRHFLVQAGVDPEQDFQGKPSFSGSHDKTWKLVESGSFQAGALNEAVWQKAAESSKVDLSKVRVFYTTSAYYDYNWTIRHDMDETFGNGFTDKAQAALLAMDSEQKEILGMFQTDGFIESNNENYEAIEAVARELDIIR